MLPPDRTPRQRMMELLTGTRLSSYQLAQMLGIAERQVEEHLTHVVKTLARDPSRRFILEPSTCPDCGYVFRHRTKLTRPSRCPHCRSEGITAPRYSIDSVRSRSGRVDSNASRQ
jgi:predicted Zn-ribbon and HTH transcriptional regulator